MTQGWSQQLVDLIGVSDHYDFVIQSIEYIRTYHGAWRCDS